MRRYLALRGETDTWPCPEWYQTVIIAKYYGITPEAVLDMPLYWKERTLIAMNAEEQAQEILSKHK